MSERSIRWTWLVAAAAVLLAVAAGLGAMAAIGLLTPSDPMAQPGQLVRLPDHRVLNFRCSGQGSPTVILEAGFGAGSNAWLAVQPRIAAVTRVCSYDRAGYGFSDPGPLPRDGAAIARDLDYGLRAAGISGPYIVIGHSAGGLYSRLFAARRRREIVGLVFVDSSVEHQPQRMAAIFGPGAGSIEGVKRRPARCLEATLAPHDPANEAALLDCAPATLDAHARQVALRPDTYRTQLSELDTLFTTTSDEVDRIGDLLQVVPGIVLSAAKADGIPAGADDPGGKVWQDFHQALAARLLHGEHRLVKSSHMMMFDRADVVASAALQLVQKAREH
jgi:pimeloyl-ACP methyl ester carboxylesterase